MIEWVKPWRQYMIAHSPSQLSSAFHFKFFFRNQFVNTPVHVEYVLYACSIILDLLEHAIDSVKSILLTRYLFPAHDTWLRFLLYRVYLARLCSI